jgi:hypothetical protein
MITMHHNSPSFTSTDKSRTPAESAACIEATVQAVKLAKAREREKRIRDDKLKQEVRKLTIHYNNLRSISTFYNAVLDTASAK